MVIEGPEQLAISQLELTEPGASDVVVDVLWSGISTGTERLLWSGRMPPFPGMGYPLVPGYESVGRVAFAGGNSSHAIGDTVFVGGARCFENVRGLFGGAAARLVVPGSKAHRIDAALGERGVLMALAATAHHALGAVSWVDAPLVVGHGALGRLLARLLIAKGGAVPVVWERSAQRRHSGDEYRVCLPEDDDRNDYSVIYDVSGDAQILDTLIARIARNGEIVLAGFYERSLSFNYPPAFIREARLRVAAEWQPADLAAVSALVESGKLSLDGLITHRCDAADASAAYRTAFDDPSCLKMILNWSARA